jgi:hypothetical protein
VWKHQIWCGGVLGFTHQEKNALKNKLLLDKSCNPHPFLSVEWLKAFL